MAADALRTSPAALRNRDPILGILRTTLPPAGIVLEVASGSGEHVTHFAASLPDLRWQPSDPSTEARASISARLAVEQPHNIHSPLDLDATAESWPIDCVDAVIAINMVHISPWASTLGLFRHAAGLLPSGGPLFLYGPFHREGEALAPSNAAFDADLRTQNSDWGLRSFEDVARQAEQRGFRLDRVIGMPANNLSVVLTKA